MCGVVKANIDISVEHFAKHFGNKMYIQKCGRKLLLLLFRKGKRCFGNRYEKKENRTIKIRVKSEGKVTVMSMLKNEEQMSTAVND